MNSSNKHFSMLAALRFGFTSMIEHVGLIIMVVIVRALLLVATVGLSVAAFLGYSQLAFGGIFAKFRALFNGQVSFVSVMSLIVPILLGVVFYFLVRSVFTIGYYAIALDLRDKDSSSLNVLWKHWSLGVSYFFGSMIFASLVSLGMMLFVVPGIVFYVRYMFFSFVMVDKKVGFMEGFRESARITEGVRLRLFGLMALVFLINIGAAALSGGLAAIIVFPALLLTQTYVYRALQPARG